MHVLDSPTHEVEAVRTHKDVAIGVYLQQVTIGRVKHQTSERETWRGRKRESMIHRFIVSFYIIFLGDNEHLDTL